jgi:dephospho-CoA kinase
MTEEGRVLVAKSTVIGLVGMPGSGKSVAAEVARKLGFTVLVMGDVVREELVKRGLKATPATLGRVMVELRAEEGAAVVAKKTIAKMMRVKSQRLIVDGVRSLAEVEEFKQQFPEFKLVAIHSSPDTRFHRIFTRRRSDDASDRRVFTTRDRRELTVGIGSAIALADYVLINEDTLAHFKTRVRAFFEEAVRD